MTRDLKSVLKTSNNIARQLAETLPTIAGLLFVVLVSWNALSPARESLNAAIFDILVTIMVSFSVVDFLIHSIVKMVRDNK